MKHLFFFTIIIFSAFASYAQQVGQAHTYDKEAYKALRKKQRHNLVPAVVLSATGGGLIIGGSLIALIGSLDKQSSFAGNTNDGNNKVSVENAGYIILGAGVLAELVSIPLYIKAHEYGRKAKEIRFKVNTNAYAIPVSGYKNISTPQIGFGLSISL